MQEELDRHKIVCFTVPKMGEQEADIQDACCWSDDKSQAAIADGATTSFLPREWAELLVKHFCSCDRDSLESIYQRWEEWLRPVQEKWRQHALQIQKDPNIPWYAKGSKEKNIGSATFVGLKLRQPNPAGEKIWEAIAVGDSCLFFIKAKLDVWLPFPINKSESFKSVTDCFHSLPEYKSSKPIWKKGVYEAGDIFLLATDALAEWILKDKEAGGNRWLQLISISSPEDFANFIGQLRADKLIKNDDTTLCRIEVAIPTSLSPSLAQPTPPKELPPKGKRKNEKSSISTVTTSLPKESPPEGKQKNGKSSISTVATSPPKESPPEEKPKNGKLPIIAGAIAVVSLVAFLGFIASLIINNDRQYNSLISKLKKYMNLGKNYSSYNQNFIQNYQLVSIYMAESNSSNQPIGYFLKNPSESEIKLWVLAPKKYIQQEQEKYFLKIQAENTPLPLYLGKPTPQELLAEDFAGYLLPGTYSVSEKQDSRTFQDAQWVKIQVRLAK